MPGLFLHVTDVLHLGGYRLRLQFNDGDSGELDLSKELNGPIFRPLREEALFKSAIIEGGTVAWPNGADFAPEFLKEAMIAQQNPRTASVHSSNP